MENARPWEGSLVNKSCCRKVFLFRILGFFDLKLTFGSPRLSPVLFSSVLQMTEYYWSDKSFFSFIGHHWR
jgi:hypothetical protein